MSRDLDAPEPGAAGGAGEDAAAAGRRLVVLRHGRTAWNAVGRGQGHTDVELDEVGHAQAAAAAPYLASLAPVALWSSDLARARQTAEALARVTGLEVGTDRRLREFDIGLRTGLTLAEFAERHPEEHASWVAGDGRRRLPGAESTQQVVDRMVPALREALEALAPGETAVVVTHGGSLKSGVTGLLGWPDQVSTSLRGIDNCAWVTVEELGFGGRLRMAGSNESVRPGHDAPERLADES